jgi:hypothetical protein
MGSGRSEHILNGGHAVCLHGTLIPTLEARVEDIWKRMFKDNGHDSIQTSLATGALKFQEIDSKLASMSSEFKTLSAQVATLADVIRQSNDLQAGIMGEGLTIEGIVRKVLAKMPASAPGSSGSSTTSMWVSLAIAFICSTIILLKVL